MTGSPNLDLVRSLYAAWDRGDFGSAEWAHAEIEFVIADGPEPGTWTGLAGMAQVNRVWLSAWEGFRAQVDECRALDDERVLVLDRWIGVGKKSGVPVADTGAQVFQIQDGKVTRWVRYYDRDRALADLSIAPETG